MNDLASLSKSKRIVLSAVWALCPLTLVAMGYGYWRTGLDFDSSAIRQQLYVQRATLVTVAAYAMAHSVTTIVRLLR
jgi:hypothetical protein